jgi:hypothetical protein
MSSPAAKGKQSTVRSDMHPIGAIDHGASGSARFEVLRLFSARSATRALALLVRMYEGGAAPRFREGVVEASEIPALMAALHEIARTAEARKRGDPSPGSVSSYRFGSLAIEIPPAGAEDRVSLLAGNKEPAKLTLDLAGLSQVERFVTRAAEKIRELERAQTPPGDTRGPESPGAAPP